MVESFGKANRCKDEKVKPVTPGFRAKRLIRICWVMYFCAYIGRLSYSACMPAMVHSGFLEKTAAGVIGTVFFTCYGFGQTAGGLVADRFSPGNVVFSGLFVSAVCNALMAAATGYGSLVTVWAVNGLCQSVIWPPLVRVFSSMLSPTDRMRGSVSMSSATALGSLAAYLLSASLIALSGWRAAFAAASFILFAMAFAWKVVYRDILRDWSCDPVGFFGKTDSHRALGSQVPLLQLLLSPTILTILTPVFIHGILKEGMTVWIPTFIVETYGTTPAVSITLTTFLPLLGIGGAYLAKHLNGDRIKGEISTACLLFAMSSVSLLAFVRFGTVNLLASLGLLCLVVGCVLGINTMFILIIPLHYGKYGRAATVSGVLNAVTYLGTAVSMGCTGYLVQSRGWKSAATGWLLASALALVFTFAGRKLPFAVRTSEPDEGNRPPSLRV